MSDGFQLFILALIVYAGLIVSALGTLFADPVMMIFTIVFTGMAVIVTDEILNRRRER